MVVRAISSSTFDFGGTVLDEAVETGPFFLLGVAIETMFYYQRYVESEIY